MAPLLEASLVCMQLIKTTAIEASVTSLLLTLFSNYTYSTLSLSEPILQAKTKNHQDSNCYKYEATETTAGPMATLVGFVMVSISLRIHSGSGTVATLVR